MNVVRCVETIALDSMLPEYLECLTTATGRQALEGASHKMLHNPGSCTFPRLSEPRRVLAARLPISSMLNSCTSLPSRRTDFPKATWIFPLTWTRVFNFTYVAWCTQPLSLLVAHLPCSQQLCLLFGTQWSSCIALLCPARGSMAAPAHQADRQTAGGKSLRGVDSQCLQSQPPDHP